MSRRERGDGSIQSYTLSGGQTRWRCQWREPVDLALPELGTKQRGKGGFLTKVEARDAMRTNLARVAAGVVPVVSDRTSFESYSRRWLDGYSCERTTRTFIGRCIDSLVPYIGATPITQLLPSDLAAAYRGLETGARAVPTNKSSSHGKLGPSTVSRYSGWVVTIFNAAPEEGLIDRDPASHRSAGRPKGPRAKRVKPFKVWDPEQTSAFCD